MPFGTRKHVPGCKKAWNESYRAYSRVFRIARKQNKIEAETDEELKELIHQVALEYYDALEDDRLKREAARELHKLCVQWQIGEYITENS